MAKATSKNSLSAALDGIIDPVAEPYAKPDAGAFTDEAFKHHRRRGTAKERPPLGEEVVLGAGAQKKSEGTVLVGAHFPPEMAKRLRVLAAEEGKTNKQLIHEALNLLFKKKGIQPFH